MIWLIPAVVSGFLNMLENWKIWELFKASVNTSARRVISSICGCCACEILCRFCVQSPGDGGQDLFSSRFEPQILAALSQHVALFPPALPDNSYPPQSQAGSIRRHARNQENLTKSNGMSPEKIPTDSLKVIGRESPRLNTKGGIFGECNKRSLRKLQRGLTMKYTLNPIDFMPRNGAKTTLNPTQLPLSNETLVSLSNFCFPGTIFALLFTT